MAVYNGPGNDEDWATAIAVDSKSNVYVTGRSVGDGTNQDYATIKYNASGKRQWVKRYNSRNNGWDQAESIAVDDRGNVYVTGSSLRQKTYADYVTIKYNKEGKKQWSARYDGPDHEMDIAKKLGLDEKGNVYVGGTSYTAGYWPDIAVVKYNNDGEKNGQSATTALPTIWTVSVTWSWMKPAMCMSPVLALPDTTRKA